MLAYVQATATVDLRYTGEAPGILPRVIGMSDASWATHVDDYTSQAGYFFNLCGAAVSWRSYRIKRVVHSSTEAEYVTCSDASRQAGYHINVMGELGLYEASGGLQIFTDSKGAEALVGNPVQRLRTKHIGAPYHYVRELVQEKVVDFQRVAPKDNAANVLTKGNSRPFHSMACHKFSLTIEDNPVFIHQ